MMKNEHVCENCGCRWIEDETDAGACPHCGSEAVRDVETEPEEAD